MLSYIPSWLDGATTLLQKLNRCIEKIESIEVTQYEALKTEVDEIKDEIGNILTEIDSLQGITETVQNDISTIFNRLTIDETSIYDNIVAISKKQDKLYLHRINGTMNIPSLFGANILITLYFITTSNENIASTINNHYNEFISGTFDGTWFEKAFFGIFNNFGEISHITYERGFSTGAVVIENKVTGTDYDISGYLRTVTPREAIAISNISFTNEIITELNI